MTTPASTTQTTDVPAAPEPERDRATLDVASQTAEALSRQPLVNGLVSGAVIVAALYFGRDLLVPLALSILVGFVLDPLVSWLKRRGVPRALAVFIASDAAGGVTGASYMMDGGWTSQ